MPGRLLRTPRLGYLVNALAVALLLALAYRFEVGYVYRFYTAAGALSALAFALALALALAQRTSRSIIDLALTTVVATSVGFAGAIHGGLLPVGAGTIYAHHGRSPADLYRHSLPGDPDLFLNGLDKSSLKSFADLPVLAGRFHERWRDVLHKGGFSAGQSHAVSLMLFTSTLWGYGNKLHPDRPGCVSSNESTGWKYQAPTFAAVRRAEIGCCDDYAFALALLLRAHGFENRFVFIRGHVFNEAKIDGRWHVLDANTNVMVAAPWNDADRDGVAVHVFPHPGTQNGRLHRPLLAEFQDFIVNMVMLGPLLPGVLMRGQPPAQPTDSLHEPLVRIGEDA